MKLVRARREGRDHVPVGELIEADGAGFAAAALGLFRQQRNLHLRHSDVLPHQFGKRITVLSILVGRRRQQRGKKLTLKRKIREFVNPKLYQYAYSASPTRHPWKDVLRHPRNKMNGGFLILAKVPRDCASQEEGGAPQGGEVARGVEAHWTETLMVDLNVENSVCWVAFRKFGS
ncbi:unnamed protein product [Cuscuta campestris]|uniref:Uncharacterized protein n=1 Tax=Cuscuta campestris TaxID=132261 RepID=A0A484LJ00_9ASTE|nr:unnamed protein product [Cuscuta campestris]